MAAETRPRANATRTASHSLGASGSETATAVTDAITQTEVGGKLYLTATGDVQRTVEEEVLTCNYEDCLAMRHVLQRAHSLV